MLCIAGYIAESIWLAHDQVNIYAALEIAKFAPQMPPH